MKDSELFVNNGKIYHLGLRPDQLAENIFVVGDPARADKVAAHFDSVEHREQNREYVTRTGIYKEMPVTVIATGIGTDNNEIALVESFGLNEFDLETREKKEHSRDITVIRLGTSGGPQKDIKEGTLAIGSYALGLDNTGMFYEFAHPDNITKKIEEEAYRILTDNTPDGSRFKGKIIPYASKATSEVVSALEKHVKGDYAVGITASASGFFAPQGREIPGLPITVPRLQEHLATLDINGLKVVNFEMESSLLFHLGRLMNYKCGTICPIIANRQTGKFLADYSEAVERCIETGLEAMLELHKNK
ncbi:MAG: nucleoside phosphorylase [Nanoarchaeota archaeon]|nr:nucleoside phosphorylase [Nanoarchaeota archaeon]MBU4352590.1 nucleoside phosphorylase [Nanoarchaeota archaeon]MBU4456466.1 nucleoside phosphorylase [Nanoarchaeota archaeon]